MHAAASLAERHQIAHHTRATRMTSLTHLCLHWHPPPLHLDVAAAASPPCVPRSDTWVATPLIQNLTERKLQGSNPKNNKFPIPVARCPPCALTEERRRYAHTHTHTPHTSEPVPRSTSGADRPYRRRRDTRPRSGDRRAPWGDLTSSLYCTTRKNGCQCDRLYGPEGQDPD